MTQPRTLLFDLAGTLTDSFEGLGRCLTYAVERMGHDLPSDAVLRGCVGPPLRETLARLMPAADAAAIERSLGYYRERFSATGWMENEVYPGIENALAGLAGQGHRMLVCTSKPLVYAERIVEHFGLAGHFAAVYGAGLDALLDDKSRLMALIIEREGLDPARCAMIGDRAQDICAALVNGVAPFGVLWGYGSREELTQAGARRLLAAPHEIAAALIGL